MPAASILALAIFLIPAAIQAEDLQPKGGKRQKLSFDQLPEKVRVTVTKNARGAKVHEVKKGVDDKGRTIYTVEVKENRTETKIIVVEDGTLVRVTTEKEDH